MNQKILELKLKGYCCSQIIVAMGLEKLEKENADFITAMAGLCNGMGVGKVCGIVSAAICLLHLADENEAEKYSVTAFYEWFEEVFEHVDCEPLLEGNPMNKVEKCPMMIEASFQKICELMDWDMD